MMLEWHETCTEFSINHFSDAYAAKVAGGYRPERPNKMDPEIFDLIDWCW